MTVTEYMDMIEYIYDDVVCSECGHVIEHDWDTHDCAQWEV